MKLQLWMFLHMILTANTCLNNRCIVWASHYKCMCTWSQWSSKTQYRMEGMLSIMVYICCISITNECAEHSELSHIMEYKCTFQWENWLLPKICFSTDVIVTGYHRVSNAPIAAGKGGVHNIGHDWSKVIKRHWGNKCDIYRDKTHCTWPNHQRHHIQ